MYYFDVIENVEGSYVIENLDESLECDWEFRRITHIIEKLFNQSNDWEFGRIMWVITWTNESHVIDKMN